MKWSIVAICATVIVFVPYLWPVGVLWLLIAVGVRQATTQQLTVRCVHCALRVPARGRKGTLTIPGHLNSFGRPCPQQVYRDHH